MADERKHDLPDASSAAATLAGGAAGFGFGMLLSPLKSKIFFFVLTATLASGGWLIYRAVHGSGAENTIDSLAPWTLRAGVSFIAAFVFAYLVRKVVKIALLIGALLVGGAILIHKLGLGLTTSDIDHLKDNIAHTAESMQHTADSWWTTAKAYLPSSTAAGAGVWRGTKHNA
ncbi:hypothetical protein LBMAG48_19380 [Phycisphaerae bacterium]|jgi:uncharacterized membrane protein (Fun14 family)|nr:hypothetical protein LBMAG48_19380 [Phycisphaerae bacterium]